ncbi:MAG: proprotein convertase P-domain-containing protein, partial [Prosthecobacter sp.]|nr:proprotein convertase P-domain-containing protein [Prosthecobacter sp.]
WNRAWNSSASPYSAASTQDLRGYMRWTTYSGGTSGSAFNADFVVYYAFANLTPGTPVGTAWSDSTTAHPLNSTTLSKMILGYPGADGYYQHSTGPFTSRYTSSTSFYMWNPYVRGGSGMSGGGVFVNSGGTWQLAGVHVSGLASGGLGAGARAINSAANQLIADAITASGGTVTDPVPLPTTETTKTFSSTTAVAIPDGRPTWTVRTLPVSGLPTAVTKVLVSLNITHAYRGDLEIVLTSPTGRAFTLQRVSGDSGDNVIYTNRDVSTSYIGTNPNGTWKLSVRDRYRPDAGKLNSVSLTISAK